MTSAPATTQQLDQLDEYFWFSKKTPQTPLEVLVDAQQDPWRIQVQGNVRLHKDVRELPHVFTEVDGEFYASFRGLISLMGFPRIVRGGVYVADNHLINLKGAPRHVGGEFKISDNPLTSLVGFPSHVDQTVIVSYDVNLPMLRLIQASHLKIYDAPFLLEGILNKYAGKGKAFMLNCALELKQAGFEGNAAWWT